MKNVQELHSSYWLPQTVSGDDEFEHLISLAQTKKAVANFVSIVAKKDIPVRFSSGRDSYTDGAEVVISANTEPNEFDCMVGLALHEGAHVLLSDFSFRQTVARHNKYAGATSDLYKNIFSPELYDLGQAIVRQKDGHIVSNMHRMVTDVLDICNILEDRRIDKWVYTRCPGYQPYYRALYDKYFLGDSVNKHIANNKFWRTPTVENYITWLLLSINPTVNTNILPGLDMLYREMDLANIDRIDPINDPVLKKNYLTITYDFTPVIWREAVKLYTIILKLVKTHAAPPPPSVESDASDSEQPSVNKSSDGVESDQIPFNSFEEILQTSSLDNELPNYDISDVAKNDTDTTTPSKKRKKVKEITQKESEKVNKQLRDFVKGNVTKKKLTINQQDAVTAIEEANATLHNIKVSTRHLPTNVVVLRKISDTIIDQTWYPFKASSFTRASEKVIADGVRLGQILTNQLQIRNDEHVTTQTRLYNGKIDRRLLSQLGMEIDKVFYKKNTFVHKPAMLHISLDASSSMSGRKWEKVVTASTALAYVSKKISNIDVVINIRGGKAIPLVSILFDSRINTFEHFKKYIRKIGPDGSTPEGLCFGAIHNLITECVSTHKVYFVNFSDGEPIFDVSTKFSMSKLSAKNRNGFRYAGVLAQKHTKSVVDSMKAHGIEVLSYFISNYSEDRDPRFLSMYGENSEFVNVTNSLKVLKTLNKLLTIRD